MSEDLIAQIEILIYVFFIIQILLWILFANTIYKTLNLIAVENRCILPKQVWFLAVPLFNIYWNFEVARRLADSLNNEFFDRKIEVEENPTRRDGFFYSLTNLLGNIPFPTFWILFIKIINLVNFGIYWYRINQYRILLIEHNKWKAENEKNEN